MDKAEISKRTFLNQKNNSIKKLFNDALNSSQNKIKSKNIEINDRVLRQIMFLFNLEIWYQLFVENNEFDNPNLTLNKFV